MMEVEPDMTFENHSNVLSVEERLHKYWTEIAQGANCDDTSCAVNETFGCANDVAIYADDIM